MNILNKKKHLLSTKKEILIFGLSFVFWCTLHFSLVRLYLSLGYKHSAVLRSTILVNLTYATLLGSMGTLWLWNKISSVLWRQIIITVCSFYLFQIFYLFFYGQFVSLVNLFFFATYLLLLVTSVILYTEEYKRLFTILFVSTFMQVLFFAFFYFYSSKPGRITLLFTVPSLLLSACLESCMLTYVLIKICQTLTRKTMFRLVLFLSTLLTSYMVFVLLCIRHIDYLKLYFSLI